MLKPLAISSSLAAILLLSGCGTEAAKSSASISAPATQKESVNKQIITRSIEAGEPLELTLPDALEYQNIEWRDENGKLLSTDPNINRLFTEAGEYRIYLTATDKQNRVKTSTVVVKVTRHNTTQQTVPNKKPVVKAKAEAVDIMDEEYIHLSDDGSYDPDGTIVKYEWRDMDGILLSTTKRLDRMLHYDPQYDFKHNGTTRYVKTLYVTDDKGATSSKSFEIIVHKKPDTNKAPTVDAGADKTITEGESVTLTATASDPDGTIQSYEWKEGSVVKGNSATLTLNNLSKGVHIFTVTVTDDKGATASDTVKVKVKQKPVENHPPVADDKSITTNEGAVHAVTLSGSDADGDTLTYTVVTQPAHGSLIGTVPNLTYVPYSGFYGTDSFTYKVNDGKADSSVATVTITVVKLPDVNRAPTANGQSVTTNEDTPKSITLTGSDPDGDTLIYTITAQPVHGTFSGTAPNLTYTPAANYNGSDSFSFTVNDGKVDSVPATVNITVNPVNDAPVGVNDTAQVEWGKSVNIPVLANDTDADGDALSLTDSPSAPAHGTAVINADGKTIDYIPNPGFYGTDTFTYKPNDGTVNGLEATVTVTVNRVCHPPLKTGQTTSYTDFDDGYYQKGADRSYTRDDAKEVVIDNTTGLMWQDDEDAKTVTKNWEDAKAYCQALTLGGYSDWRLPIIRELKTIVDRGRHDPAIDPTFQNVVSSHYWSSTTYARETDHAWGGYFYYGSDHWHPKSNTGYVRCVRSADD